jgi:antitoxin CptB
VNSSEQNRLRWKCRRGLLELDIVLERFVQKHSPRGEEAALFSALLDLPDNDLWDIVAGHSDAYERRFLHVVARLRAA